MNHQHAVAKKHIRFPARRLPRDARRLGSVVKSSSLKLDFSLIRLIRRRDDSRHARIVNSPVYK
jgi:hypothetical protein